MRSVRSWSGSLVAVAYALAPARVGAQDTAAVRAGDLVRLRTRRTDAHGHAYRCEARISGVSGDTLLLAPTSRWGGCPRQAYAPSDLTSLDVARGGHGSRLAHSALGLLGGAAVGGTLGWALAGDGCSSQGGCDDGDLAVVAFTFLGIVTGGLTGTIVGVALPAGPRWVATPGDAPVRVAGLTLRPSIRWSGGR